MKWCYKLVVALWFLYSCNDKEERPSQQINYFPLVVGNSWTYAVDSITYSVFNNSIDTYHYESKFTLQGWIDSGQNSYYGQWFRKDSGLSNWIETQSSLIVKDEFQLTELEQGLRVISLVFPVSERKTWNGNAMNVLPFRRFRYSQVGLIDSVLGPGGVSTLVVDRQNDSNFFQLIRNRRKYAENIGLFERIEINIEEQEKGKPEGYQVHYQLIDYTR